MVTVLFPSLFEHRYVCCHRMKPMTFLCIAVSLCVCVVHKSYILVLGAVAETSGKNAKIITANLLCKLALTLLWAMKKRTHIHTVVYSLLPTPIDRLLNASAKLKSLRFELCFLSITPRLSPLPFHSSHALPLHKLAMQLNSWNWKIKASDMAAGERPLSKLGPFMYVCAWR